MRVRVYMCTCTSVEMVQVRAATSGQVSSADTPPSSLEKGFLTGRGALLLSSVGTDMCAYTWLLMWMLGSEPRSSDM